MKKKENDNFFQSRKAAHTTGGVGRSSITPKHKGGAASTPRETRNDHHRFTSIEPYFTVLWKKFIEFNEVTLLIFIFM